MTREEIEKGMEEFKANAKNFKTFREAYEAGVAFHYKNHHCYIVTCSQINKKFGASEFMMPTELADTLRSLGWRRSSRQIYETSKRVKVIPVWVLGE